MLKDFTKKKQATRIGDLEKKRRNLVKSGLRVLSLFLVCSMMFCGWGFLHNPRMFPIKKIQIKGDYQHVNKEPLNKIVASFSAVGFFNLNIDGLKRQLLTLPWVAKASVSRVWPSGLRVYVTEQKAIASNGGGALINADDQLFFPDKTSIPEGLPVIKAQSSMQEKAFNDYKKMSNLLTSIGLKITLLSITPRDAVRVALSDGISLILGRKDALLRLKRFVAVFPSVFALKARSVEYVDLRYSNGMAVKWKE